MRNQYDLLDCNLIKAINIFVSDTKIRYYINSTKALYTHKLVFEKLKQHISITAYVKQKPF